MSSISDNTPLSKLWMYQDEYHIKDRYTRVGDEASKNLLKTW